MQLIIFYNYLTILIKSLNKCRKEIIIMENTKGEFVINITKSTLTRYYYYYCY